MRVTKKILCTLKPQQVAVGLAAILSLGTFQFQSTTVNAAPINGGPGLSTPVTTISFSEVMLAEYTVVTDQYSGLGVTFGMSLVNSDGLYYVSSGGTGVTPHGLRNYDAAPPYGDSYNPFMIKFSAPVTEAAFQMVTNGSTDTFTALLNGVPVESFSTTTGGWRYYGFTGIEFDEIQVMIGNDPACCGSHMRLDNIQIGAPAIIDADGDGYGEDVDCNDDDPTINPDPSTAELPGNFVDENCDGDLGMCDPCKDWKNHGSYVRCVAQDSEFLVEAGILTEEEGDALVTSSAQSSIGKKNYVPMDCQ